MQTHTNEQVVLKIVLQVMAIVMNLFPAVHADSSFREYVDRYFVDAKKSGSPLFFAGCQTPSEKAYLIFRTGQRDGLLIEARNKDIINLANILTKDGNLVVGETHGGVYTYKTTSALLQELAGGQFRLQMPDQAAGILETQPQSRCQSIQPD